LTFFLDNNLSPILAEGLRAFGEDVRHLREVSRRTPPTRRGYRRSVSGAGTW
jgi:PIN like domain